MVEIPEIGIHNIGIITTEIPDYDLNLKQNIPKTPPVTLSIGSPIIELPGCVEYNPGNKKSNQLVDDDPRGNRVLCDGTVPSYDPMNYEPEQLILTTEAPVPNVRPPDIEAPEVPSTGDLKVEKDPDCPGPGNLRVGDTTQSGEERVIGHQLIQDPGNPAKKICETLYEPTTTLQKYLPTVNQATSVTALAVVATAGAAATPLLIRIIRPAVKKLWTTIQKKVGKDVRQLSKSEIETNKYREKKGLPPVKRK